MEIILSILVTNGNEVCKRLNHDSIKTTQQKYAQFSWRRLEQDFPSLLPKQAKNDECIHENRIHDSNKRYISPLQMN